MPYGFGLSLHRQRSEALQLSALDRIVQHATDQQLPRPGRWSDEAQGQLGRLHAGCVDTHAVSTSVGHPDAVVRFIRDQQPALEDGWEVVFRSAMVCWNQFALQLLRRRQEFLLHTFSKRRGF